ncbi:MAG: galactose mutarotase [Planctomycetaceae bacterium]|jgi:aldose 1-epimerase|nr:galactose mutarotase [Planctomycetaceae bacterium]
MLPTLRVFSLFSAACLLTASVSCQPTGQPNGEETNTPPVGEHDHDHHSEHTPSEEPAMRSESEPYGEMPDGTPITQYHLTNDNGMTVSVINYGAIVTSVIVPDKNGNAENVTLTQPDLAGWLNNGPYFGAVVGRYANRIANGKFTLDDKEYTLATNNAPSHLHGGEQGFDKVVWQAALMVPKDDQVGIVLNYTSVDGEEGYPGTLKVESRYILTADNELRMEYSATSDQKTVVNLTNHCYWNLGGASSGKILDHQLTLECDQYLPVGEAAIPTGELSPVADTPMDFTAVHTIGERIDQVEGGYDHCWVVNGEQGTLRPAASVVDPETGRVMTVSTDQPGIQFYTGNFLNGEENNGGFNKNEGFCLETQLFPDSPNQPDFPSSVLEPGQVYKHTTVHQFSVSK